MTGRDLVAHSDLGVHLQRLEEALLNAATRRDRAKVAALLAEDFREFGSSGRVWSRQQTLDLLATEDYTPPVMEDFRCEPITDDIALVTYKTVRTDPTTAEKRAALRSSLWIKEAGMWRVRFHQGTPATKIIRPI
jgi:hypothetical protein